MATVMVRLNIHGLHSERFLKFPDFFLTNVKFF